MSWIAVAIGGSAVIGAITSSNAANRAADAQTSAANAANAAQRETYEQTRADLSPYREAGIPALAAMQGQDFNRDFTMSDFTADPGYQFRMAEGLKAINNSAAAQGGRLGGATLKSLSAFSGNLASDEYQNAYNRFNADRDRRFSRLSTLAGIGQNSAAMTGSAGQNYANQYGANTMGAANATGAAAISSANSTNNMLGQGMTAAALYGKNGASFCDERLKENIVEVSKEELNEMKRHLKAYHFNYKSQVHGTGDFVGVMAQDLEKSKLGRSLVFEDCLGNKQIDITRVMMLFLATMAEAS